MRRIDKRLPPHDQLTRSSGLHTLLRRRALTLLELLVSMSLIVILIGLICPAIQSARESARQLQCTSHLKQIGLALHQCHETQRHLPAGWAIPRPSRPVIADGQGTAWGWAVDLLPFLEQPSLVPAIHRDAALVADVNSYARTVRPAILLCPSDVATPLFDLYMGDDEEGGRSSFSDDAARDHHVDDEPQEKDVIVSLPQSNYVAIFGTSDPDDCEGHAGEGAFPGPLPVSFRDLTRGLSQVAVVGERTARRLPATGLGIDLRGEDAPARLTGFAGRGPNQPEADECELDSRHPGSINLAFADGHVRKIANDIDQPVYQSLARRSE